MVTVVQIPPTPKGGGGGGMGNLIAMLIKNAKNKAAKKRMSAELQKYVDDLEAVQAQGGARKDAADVELPKSLLGSSSGINAAMRIQESIFGPAKKDPLTGFFTRGGEFISDVPRSQRPKGGLTRQEFSALKSGQTTRTPSESDKNISAMLNREMSRRKKAGGDTSPQAKAGIRGAIRLWNTNEKATDRQIEATYGRADPNDPNRFIYDSPESRKLGAKAKQEAFRSFVETTDEPPTLPAAIAGAIETVGGRAKQPEVETQPKPPTALQQILENVLGKTTETKETPALAPSPSPTPAAPAGTPADPNLRNIGAIKDTEINIPKTIKTQQEAYDYVNKNYDFDEQEVRTFIQQGQAQ